MTLIIATYKEGSSHERRDRDSRARKRPVVSRSVDRRQSRKTDPEAALMRTLKNRRGQGLVEYVLILVLMAVLAIGALHRVGAKTHNALSQTGDAMEKEMDFSGANGSKSGKVNEG